MTRGNNSNICCRIWQWFLQVDEFREPGR